MNDEYSFRSVLKKALDAMQRGKEGFYLYVKRAGNKITEIWLSYLRRW